MVVLFLVGDENSKWERVEKEEFQFLSPGNWLEGPILPCGSQIALNTFVSVLVKSRSCPQGLRLTIPQEEHIV